MNHLKGKWFVIPGFCSWSNGEALEEMTWN